MNSTTAEDLFDLLAGRDNEAEELRERLHRQPRLSGKESDTLETVLAALPEGGQVTRVADTGAVVRFGPPGPAVAIRGEMDALPIHEQTATAFTSEHDGVMHACGHDVHLAAAVQVAHVAHALGFPTPLLIVLQPREETYPSGAQDIADSRILQDQDCSVMIGAHVQPSLAAGTVACTPGPVNASSDEFDITIHGREGHAAYPHLISDPIVALSEVVLSLQSIVSRSVDPMVPALVGVSSCAAGTAANVVPGDARATGTIRALSLETRSLVLARIEEVVSHVARAHRCRAKVGFTQGEPLLYNDPELASSIAEVLSSRRFTVDDSLRSLGSDDFSFFAAEIPSVMMFVGTETDESLHSARFLPTTTDLQHVARAMLCGYVAGGQRIHAERRPHVS